MFTSWGRVLMMVAAAAAALSACSGTGTRPCEAETTCGCYERRSECKLVTESCWCPSECVPGLNCVCGGGKFLSCATK